MRRLHEDDLRHEIEIEVECGGELKNLTPIPITGWVEKHDVFEDTVGDKHPVVWEERRVLLRTGEEVIETRESKK